MTPPIEKTKCENEGRTGRDSHSQRQVRDCLCLFILLLITPHRIIQDLTDDIVVDIGALYKASEAVALLDVLWSFAHASIRT